MREVFATAAQWLAEGHGFAFATLVDLREAATAPLGTTIAVDGRGTVAGNIGAGCYEAEIVDACRLTVEDGRRRVLDIDLERFDELSGATACGAVLEVVVWRPEPEFLETARAIAEGDRACSFALEYERDGRLRTFEAAFPRRDTLILVGATTLAAEIAALARRLDMRTVVVDPRPVFATAERMREADEIVREWPDAYLPRALNARTPVVVLSHDPKFDVPALRCALASEAPFVGLLGSRRSQASRRDALRDLGVAEADLERIHGPVGLDIGGATPAETALSILAEIVSARSGASGAPLGALSTAIHARGVTL